MQSSLYEYACASKKRPEAGDSSATPRDRSARETALGRFCPVADERLHVGMKRFDQLGHQWQFEQHAERRCIVVLHHGEFAVVYHDDSILEVWRVNSDISRAAKRLLRLIVCLRLVRGNYGFFGAAL